MKGNRFSLVQVAKAVLVLGAMVGCGRLGFDPGDVDAALVQPDAMPSGLRAWLRFAPGAERLDSVTGDLGTCTNCPISVASGPRGTAGSFDGTTCLKFPILPSDAEFVALTVSFWFHAPSMTPAASMTGRPHNGETSTSNVFELTYASVGDLLFITQYGPGGAEYDWDTALFTIDNNWHHLAGTFDEGLKAYYVDGVEISSGGLPTNSMDWTDDPWHTGCDNNVGLDDSFFVGELADVRLYDRALSVAEIRELAAP